MNLESGADPPVTEHMPRLNQVLRGIRIIRLSTPGNHPRRRLPISPPLLRKIKAAWEKSALSVDRIMLWAAFLTCYFGFMRSGELCSSDSLKFLPSSELSINDVCVDNLRDPQWVRMHLKCSTTDPFGEGASIFILRTCDDLCPVAALLAWLIRRGNSPGSLFRFASGKNLTRDLFVKHLRKAIQAAARTSRGIAFILEQLPQQPTSEYQTYISN